MPSAIAMTSGQTDRPSPIRRLPDEARPHAAIAAAAPKPLAAGSRGRQVLGGLEDAGLSLLLALTFPLVVLVVGAPAVLVVRLLIEISRRW